MSTSYDKIIHSDAKTIVKINFTGIKEGIADKASLRMTLFAIDKHTGSPRFNAEMPFATIKSLYDHMHSISIVRDSNQTKSGKFIETDGDAALLLDQIKQVDGRHIKLLLGKISNDKKSQQILAALSETELESVVAAYKHQTYKEELNNLETLLELEDSGKILEEIDGIEKLKKYAAKQPEKIFQNWIVQNLWVFGIDYSRKHEARKIGFFSEADLIMESLDGFLDLIELKRPKLSYSLFGYDSSHKCYYPSKDLATVLGQSLFYIQKLDEYKHNIENEYKVKVLRPRVKIIIGRTKVGEFDDQAFEALRMLNSNLYNIQVLSYDYLLSCGRKIISHYD